MADVKINLRKLDALQKVTSSRSPQMIAFKQASAQEYRGFLFERFDKFSRGGGNWKHTKRFRQQPKRRGGQFKLAGGRKGANLILRDTHTLYRALTPVYSKRPGQYQALSGNRIIVGIKGGKHPKFKGGVGRLAAIHHFGKGRMPKRTIMVMPPRDMQRKWARDLKDITKKR